MKRTFLTKELFYSFIAIVKYIPRAIITPQVDGMLFYETQKQAEFRQRLQDIKADSKRAWGSMDVAQMLHHISLSIGGALGYFKLFNESYWLSRTLFKWILVDFFPSQPKGLRIPLNFIIAPGQIFDFDQEKQLLQDILEKALLTPTEEWGPHPLFGKLNRRQWGKLIQIHLDFHLKQFNL